MYIRHEPIENRQIIIKTLHKGTIISTEPIRLYRIQIHFLENEAVFIRIVSEINLVKELADEI